MGNNKKRKGGGTFDVVNDVLNPGNIVRNIVREPLTAVFDAGGAKSNSNNAISNLEKSPVGDIDRGVRGVDDIKSNLNGDKAKEIAADQAAEAKRQEAARIKAEQEREGQKRKSTAYGLARNRQKSIMGEGRGGTILTSPLGTASGAINSGKTLLGQ